MDINRARTGGRPRVNFLCSRESVVISTEADSARAFL
jgi:hypothetical protein